MRNYLKFMLKTFKNNRSQGMVEFALVIPILLLIVYGLFEVGRLIFTYSIVATAAREAARYGSATGLDDAGVIIRYNDCDGIRQAARNVDFIGVIQSINISYDLVVKNPLDPSGLSYVHEYPPTCPFGSTVRPETGSRIIVVVTGSFTPLTAIVPLQTMHPTSTSERTILGNVDLGDQAPAAPPGFFTLLIGKAGNGIGTVLSNPAGIACGSICSNDYTDGTQVVLSAVPSPGSTFDSWSGCDSVDYGVTPPQCHVKMNSFKNVVARFNSPNVKLTINIIGDGLGTVTSYPLGINCPGVCEALFTGGSSVQLTATASNHSYTFTGWSGGGCSGTAPCTVNMDVAKTVTAAFNVSTHMTLSVGKSGSGNLQVNSNPAGIICGSTCSYSFSANTNVTLSVIDDGSAKLVGWIGCDSIDAYGGCKVKMNNFKTVIAIFDSLTHKLTVYKTGSGNGTITSDPSGILCDPTCSYDFLTLSTVTLTASVVPDSGATFTGWSGACTGSATTCSVVMNASTDQVVYANFDLGGESTLTINKTGNGFGTVTSADGNINCGPGCSYASYPYALDTPVELTAAASPNSNFDSWSGCDSQDTSTPPKCLVTMSAAKTVTAKFMTYSCNFTTVSKTYQNNDQTITWVLTNDNPNTPPIVIDHILVFWDGGIMQRVWLDGYTWWSGNQGPSTFSISGSGKILNPGSHTIIFSFPAPDTIAGHNFNATLYFVPQYCQPFTTYSWLVK